MTLGTHTSKWSLRPTYNLAFTSMLMPTLMKVFLFIYFIILWRPVFKFLSAGRRGKREIVLNSGFKHFGHTFYGHIFIFFGGGVNIKWKLVYFPQEKTLIDNRGRASLGDVLAGRKNKKKLPQIVPEWELCAIKIKRHWEFPGGPVVMALSFHCRGHEFHLWSGN